MYQAQISIINLCVLVNHLSQLRICLLRSNSLVVYHTILKRLEKEPNYEVTIMHFLTYCHSRLGWHLSLVVTH
jgi:hypothetical protein